MKGQIQFITHFFVGVETVLHLYGLLLGNWCTLRVLPLHRHGMRTRVHVGGARVRLRIDLWAGEPAREELEKAADQLRIFSKRG